MVSIKLAKLGIQTYLDPKMTCGHTGVKRYTGDFQSWLIRGPRFPPPPVALEPVRRRVPGLRSFAVLGPIAGRATGSV